MYQQWKTEPMKTYYDWIVAGRHVRRGEHAWKKVGNQSFYLRSQTSPAGVHDCDQHVPLVP